MDDIKLEDFPPELDDLAQDVPEDMINELADNFTKMAMEFLKRQSSRPIENQLLLFFGCLLIPVSLLRKYYVICLTYLQPKVEIMFLFYWM